MVIGFLILLGCQLAGELIVYSLDIPVPGAVVGMVLLLIALMLRGSVSDDLRRTAEGLLGVIPLLLVPAGVGLMVHADLIAKDWLPILLALLVSTLVTLVLVTWMLKRQAAESAEGDR